MSSPSEAFELSLAAPEDGAELAALYRCDDGFAGDIRVLFARGQDAYASLQAEGERIVVPIMRERASGRIVGMGACVIATAWVNGELTQVGYLTGMKVLPQFRRRLRIPQVYAFLREHSPEVTCFYTTILADNPQAQRMLERPRANMPGYRPVDTYTTVFLRRALRPRRVAGAGTVAELLELAGPAGQFNLTRAEPAAGLSDAEVRILRDDRGTPLAGCAVTVPAHKEYLVQGYGGRYAPLSKLPVHWAGYPRLPRAGSSADYACLSLLSGQPPAVSALLHSVAWEQRERDFVMAGVAQGHPLAGSLAEVRAIRYRSVLYTVGFANTQHLDGRPVEVEVGLL